MSMWQPTHVKVTVKQAKGLIAKGKNGTNNAFVVIGIGKEKYQTSIREKVPSQNVDWREECELEIPSHGNTATLQLTVYHHNSLGIDEFLGQVNLALNEFDVYEKPKFRFYQLKGKPEKDKKKGEKDRGELEVMVNFIVKSGSFLDLSKKEKQKSSTSLKNFGGSLLSIGSKGDKGLKKFARSVDQRINKITKPKRKKSKNNQSHDHGGYPNELMESQQRYGDADPGVISDEDDDDFRFDEDIKVYTHTGSPHSSTLSRESSLAQEQMFDQVEEKQTEQTSMMQDTFAAAATPTISHIEEESISPISPVKVNVIPSSPEYVETEPPNFMTERSASYEEAISLPKKVDASFESGSESSIVELHMHHPQMKEEESPLSKKFTSEEFYTPASVETHYFEASDSSKDSLRSLNLKKSDASIDRMIQHGHSPSYPDDVSHNQSSTSERIGLSQTAYLNDVEKDSSYDSAHTRSASDGSSHVSSVNAAIQIVGNDSQRVAESIAKDNEPQEDSGSFSNHLENDARSSKTFASKHDANRPVVLKKSATGTQSYPICGSNDSIGPLSGISADAYESKSKPISRSGSLSEKRVSDPIVDEWEQKLYGRCGITGSTENVSMTGSRSSLNTSRSSSIHDIYRDDSFTRLPEVKPIYISRKNESTEHLDNKKPKKKGISAMKKRFFEKASGNHNKSLQEEDSRIVEGGNDRLPSPPTRVSRIPQEIHNKYSGKSREDLLEMILNLEGVIQKQVQHSTDLEEYIDNLLLRVMDATPHILQGSV